MAQFVAQLLQVTKLAVDFGNFFKGNSLYLSTWPLIIFIKAKKITALLNRKAVAACPPNKSQLGNV